MWELDDAGRPSDTLTEEVGCSKQLMIDATHLKAYRTSASLLKKDI